MVIKQNFMPNSQHPKKSPYTMTPKYITLHAGSGVSAADEIAGMIDEPSHVSYHFAVDDKEAVQGLPLNRNAWHCNDGVNGTGNRESIGIMICCSRSGDTQYSQALKNAAWLTANLMGEHNIPLSNVCTAHHWNNKVSSSKLSELEWQQFMRMVEEEHQAGAGSIIGSFQTYMPSTATEPDLPHNQSNQPEFVPGHVIVGMKDGFSISAQAFSPRLSSRLRIADTELLMHPEPPAASGRFSQTGSGDILLLNLDQDDTQSVLDAVSILEQDPNVAYAEPDYLQSEENWEPAQIEYTAQTGTTSVLWSLQLVNAQDAWNISTGASSVKVGIIDSGIDSTHPNLAPNMDNALGYDFVQNIPNGFDERDHGTFVAGIVGAVGNNSYNMKGIAPQVSLVSLKVRDPITGKYPNSASIKAIEYANKNGIRILNYSLGSDSNSKSLNQAIESFNGLLVASAGNQSRDADVFPRYPGALVLPNLISVGNSNSSDKKASSSNWGRTVVDLFAPGRDVTSTSIGGKFRTSSGTSYSSPLVAGAAVLALALDPSLTPAELKQAILSTVDRIPAFTDLCVAGGRLNAARLVSYIQDNLPTNPCTSIGPPSNVRLGDIRQTSISVVWDTPQVTDDIQAYELFRDNSKIAEISSGSPRIYEDTGLTPDTGYSYYMRSIAASGDSNTAYGKTEAETIAVQPPRNLRASGVGTDEITIAWDLPAVTSNVSGFYIYRGNSRVATLSPSATSYRDTGLNHSTTYQYRAASFDSAGNEADSNTINVSTAVLVTIQPPRNLRASGVGTDEITIAWDLPAVTSNVSGFYIYRGNSRVATLSPSTTSYRDTGLNHSTTYQYRAASFDSAGNEADSNTINVSTAVLVTIQPPRNLRASGVGTDEITIAWDLPAVTSNVSGFYIYRGNSRVATLSPSTTSYRDTGLNHSTTYQYRAASFDSAGNEADSNTINVSTAVLVTIQPPRNLRVSSVGTNEITITWNLPTSTNNISGFYVYRNNVRIATLSPTTTSYRNTGLTPSTTYQYRVSSYNNTGREADSNTIDVTTNQIVAPPPINDTWNSNRVYNGGEEVIYQGLKYRAKYYSKGTPPDGQNANSAWKYIDVIPLPWRNNIPYDGNERVTYEGATYTSRFWTSAGTLPTVTSAWVRS